MYFIKTIYCMYLIFIFAYLFNKSIIHFFFMLTAVLLDRKERKSASGTQTKI